MSVKTFTLIESEILESAAATTAKPAVFTVLVLLIAAVKRTCEIGLFGESGAGPAVFSLASISYTGLGHEAFYRALREVERRGFVQVLRRRPGQPSLVRWVDSWRTYEPTEADFRMIKRHEKCQVALARLEAEREIYRLHKRAPETNKPDPLARGDLGAASVARERHESSVDAPTFGAPGDTLSPSPTPASAGHPKAVSLPSPGASGGVQKADPHESEKRTRTSPKSGRNTIRCQYKRSNDPTLKGNSKDFGLPMSADLGPTHIGGTMGSALAGLGVTVQANFQPFNGPNTSAPKDNGDPSAESRKAHLVEQIMVLTKDRHSEANWRMLTDVLCKSGAGEAVLLNEVCALEDILQSRDPAKWRPESSGRYLNAQLRGACKDLAIQLPKRKIDLSGVRVHPCDAVSVAF